MVNICEEASVIANGSRREAYGHPLDNFGQIAALWHAAFGWDVTPHQVGYAMVLTKLSRQTHKPQRDNLVDMAGYVLTVEMIDEELDRRDAIEEAQKKIVEAGA